jgi:hypothetical protein
VSKVASDRPLNPGTPAAKGDTRFLQHPMTSLLREELSLSAAAHIPRSVRERIARAVLCV